MPFPTTAPFPLLCEEADVVDGDGDGDDFLRCCGQLVVDAALVVAEVEVDDDDVVVVVGEEKSFIVSYLKKREIYSLSSANVSFFLYILPQRKATDRILYVGLFAG